MVVNADISGQQTNNKNRCRRIIRAAVFILLLSPAVLALWLKLSWVGVTALPPLRDGDIVFNTSPSRQSLAVGIATRSWLTHVGFVRIENDKPYVIEASATTRKVPFADWVAESIGGRLKIMRSDDMTAAQVDKAVQWSARHFGKPYDIFFAPGHDRFYCSELVGDAFAAAGVTLGTRQKLRDLHLTSAPVQKLIGERWSRHPHCTHGKAQDVQSCMDLIGDLEIITPVSIADDPALHIVYSNYLF